MFYFHIPAHPQFDPGARAVECTYGAEGWLSVGECVLDLRGLAAGVYLVRVGTPRGTATKRLVVQ